MFSIKRYSAVASSLLLSLAAGQAMAADHNARLESKDCARPEFPVSWQNDGESGNVLVAYLVDVDGKVVDTKVVESSGSLRVDRASAKAGARCSFQPGAKNGQAALSWTKVRYIWQVE